MNHQLATRPIDVRGVYDDDLRTLCRGLLLRDPQRRFGAAEVARWLAGDPTLAAPDEAERAATRVKPYRIGESRVHDAQKSLPSRWRGTGTTRGRTSRAGSRALDRAGAARLQPAAPSARHAGGSQHRRRHARAALPSRGLARAAPRVARTSRSAATSCWRRRRKSADGDPDARRWLDSSGAPTCSRRSPDAVRSDRSRPRVAQRLEALPRHAGRSASAPHGESRSAGEPATRIATARHVDFDQLVFGHVVQRDAPQPHDVHGALLLLLNDPPQADALRADVTAGRARLVEPARGSTRAGQHRRRPGRMVGRACAFSSSRAPTRRRGKAPGRRGRARSRSRSPSVARRCARW